MKKPGFLAKMKKVKKASDTDEPQVNEASADENSENKEEK